MTFYVFFLVASHVFSNTVYKHSLTHTEAYTAGVTITLLNSIWGPMRTCTKNSGFGVKNKPKIRIWQSGTDMQSLQTLLKLDVLRRIRRRRKNDENEIKLYFNLVFGKLTIWRVSGVICTTVYK